jgi:uncharacterized protein (DUF885 family)
MRNKLQPLFLLACFSLSVAPLRALAPETAATRLATQNALFEEQYEASLKESPERATGVGDYRYNDRLNDYSLSGVERRHAATVAYLARIKSISTEGFSEQDLLSHVLFERMMQQGLDDYAMKEYEMPVSQVDGPHLSLADLPNGMPFDSVKHYEDYIARLHQIPRVFLQTEEVLAGGMKDQLMPVKFLLEKVPVQCEGTIAADPFLLPIGKIPASFSPEEKARLTKAITDAVNSDVLPAYKDFGAWIAANYAPKGRTALSVTSLPGGMKRYQNNIHQRTTTDMTPEAVHQLGLSEIDRISGEMTVIAKKQGFADLASFRKSINSDSKWVPTSSEQILDDFRKYIAQMQPKLPELFTYIPGAPVTVEAIPPYQAAASTHYQTGTPDGKRPGRVSVATSNFAQRTLVLDEAVAYHEGIPGHHMQLSVAQTIKGLPKFRLHSGNSGYTEGWALYAEQLGKEIGFYKDPVSDYGRLNSELFRAVRLVVDTGIHSKGWTRDQVVAFMRANDVNEPLIQTETDRYIAWPGQALAYKLGQLKFRELRARAQKELGPKFDIRTFHDEMLNGGVLPLGLLDERTNKWIAAQK